ncbi:hypothetical protein [Leifsonia sp. Leaf336]|uniref:hypothetical protein n=1 Tax=Leifsonia sp. Leaf336 TaxID=1736341 RepID=UPI0012F73328|nr:hypothetical protein [Leifsonia sp. Leaf336]
MDTERLVMFLAGLGVIFSGVLIVVFRDAVARRNRRNIEDRFGQTHPGFAAKSTPLKMAVVGALLIPIGLSIIAKSFGA